MILEKPSLIEKNQYSRATLTRLIEGPFSIDTHPRKTEVLQQLVTFGKTCSWDDWKRDMIQKPVYNPITQIAWPQWSIRFKNKMPHNPIANFYYHALKFQRAFVMDTKSSNGNISTKIVMGFRRLKGIGNRRNWSFLQLQSDVSPVWKYESAQNNAEENSRKNNTQFNSYDQSSDWATQEQITGWVKGFAETNGIKTVDPQRKKATNQRLEALVDFEIDCQVNTAFLKETVGVKVPVPPKVSAAELELEPEPEPFLIEENSQSHHQPAPVKRQRTAEGKSKQKLSKQKPRKQVKVELPKNFDPYAIKKMILQSMRQKTVVLPVADNSQNENDEQQQKQDELIALEQQILEIAQYENEEKPEQQEKTEKEEKPALTEKQLKQLKAKQEHEQEFQKIVAMMNASKERDEKEKAERSKETKKKPVPKSESKK